MITGRGTFQKRRVVDGSLEISAGGATDDERLLEWVRESRVVLPMLDTIVRNGHHGPDRLRSALEDLRLRVEALEREVARWRAARSDERLRELAQPLSSAT